MSLLNKRVRLQSNSSGLWLDVLRVRDISTTAVGYLRDAVELLAAVDPAAVFRVIDSDLQGTVLMTYSLRQGWRLQ